MNAVLFTQSFDACVGHTEAKHIDRISMETYKGTYIDYSMDQTTKETNWHVRGRTDSGNAPSMEQAQKAARAAVDAKK